MGKCYLSIEDIQCYQVASQVGDDVWGLVIKWGSFERYTIGTQFTRAADSIAANLAEGFGRYNKKEKIHFYRYSQGSVHETIDWTKKARRRHLMTEDQYKNMREKLDVMPRLINQFIRFTDEKLQQ